MFDKEIEALAKCTECLKELDDNSKYRVLKYLFERFGNINSIPNFTQNFTNNHNPIPLQNNQPETNYEEVSKIEGTGSNNDYPTIKQLLIKNYPKNETEWILCFAFLTSNFGEDTFKKEQIIEKYREANKWDGNATVRKNFSQNLNACIRKDWIKDFNKDEFILKQEGIDYAKEIMTGNSIAKEIKRSKKTKNNLDTTA